MTTDKVNDTFLVEAVPPTFYPVVNDRSSVARTFGLEEKDLVAELPIQPVDTGLGHLIVPVSSLDALMKVRRDIPALKQLCSSVGVREAQLFTFDVYDKMHDLHTRNLCPRESIEDPGCGVGNAALAAYLFNHLERHSTEETFLAEQGVVIEMPCLIETRVHHADDGIQVLVGGTGKVMIRGILDY